MGSSIECAVRSVCVCICVCIRVLPFTAHVCGVLLCVRDRALHRVALAHGVFDRHAHKCARIRRQRVGESVPPHTVHASAYTQIDLELRGAFCRGYLISSDEPISM